jgi:putative acetyltransferase
MIEIRRFDPRDAETVSRLVRQVFDEHVAATFEPEGVMEMHRHVDPTAIAERAETHMTLEAWSGTDLVGVLELRESTRISMLFVATSHMGMGIASQLVACAEEACRSAGQTLMTVHSSLNAEAFYRRVGFVPIDRQQKVHGFAFLPMEKRLPTKR